MRVACVVWYAAAYGITVVAIKIMALWSRRLSKQPIKIESYVNLYVAMHFYFGSGKNSKYLRHLCRFSLHFNIPLRFNAPFLPPLHIYSLFAVLLEFFFTIYIFVFYILLPRHVSHDFYILVHRCKYKAAPSACFISTQQFRKRMLIASNKIDFSII